MWSAFGVTVSRTKPQKDFFNLSIITIKTPEWSATLLETEKYGVRLFHVIESDGLTKDNLEKTFNEEARRFFQALC